MPVTVALAGDTMLGRGVAERLAVDPGHELLAAELVAIARDADLFVLNLECCISDRGEPVREPGQGFFFRAPPVGRRAARGVRRHVRDARQQPRARLRPDALEDTLDHLGSAGIAAVGAGPDEAAARTPVVLQGGGLRVRVVAVTDHPSAYAAAPDRPGIAFADLLSRRHPRLAARLRRARRDADVTIVSPHWGPNMRAQPVAHVRRAAAALEEAGATLDRRPLGARPAGPARAHAVRPGRLHRRLRRRLAAAQRPRAALADHARRRRPAPDRSRAAQARVRSHTPGERCRSHATARLARGALRRRRVERAAQR